MAMTMKHLKPSITNLLYKKTVRQTHAEHERAKELDTQIARRGQNVAPMRLEKRR